MPGPPTRTRAPIGPLGAPESAGANPATDAGHRAIAAAVGLAIAGAAAPIAVTVIAAATGLLGPPLATSTLVALLVLAPAGVGLAAALTGLRRVGASLAAQADGEAEQAVLRVFIDTLVFGYALGVAAVTASARPESPFVPVAALALVAAWLVLLHIILWPAASPWRRLGAMALDVVLFSAFLHFGGSEVAGWYPLYLLAIFHAGLRFGRGAMFATASASLAGFAVVVLSTGFWRQQPALAAGLVGALAILPAFAAAAMRAVAPARGTDDFMPAPIAGYPLDDVSTAAGRRALPRTEDVPQSPGEPSPRGGPDRITPIAAHPKFSLESAAAIDPRAIDELRTIGGDPGFLREVFETFRADTERIMAGMDQAVATGNAASFARGLVALRRAAGHLGDTPLGELVTSLQGLSASELRQQGPHHLQRLDAEIERLTAGLRDLLPAGEARRP